MRVELIEEQPDFVGIFDFSKYTYEVLFTRVEKHCFLKLFSKKSHNTLYYIRSSRRYKFDCPRDNSTSKVESEFLVQGSNSKRYFFTPLSGVTSLIKVVYWDNAQEPSELITRMKTIRSQDDPYVVFSSDDL